MLKKNNCLIEVQDVFLDYGNLSVLKNINFTLNRGEIHALIGEHGTGKSSLATIISGFSTPKTGSVYFKGKKTRLSVSSAKKNGIELVTQDNKVFSKLSVANNIVLGFNNRKSEKLVQIFFDTLGIHINPRAIVQDLSLSDRVMVDICKHIYNNPQVLILDEALEKAFQSLSAENYLLSTQAEG